MAAFTCPCASTDCAFFPLFLPDNAKYGLDAVVNEGEETLGYTGTDAAVIDDWFTSILLLPIHSPTLSKVPKKSLLSKISLSHPSQNGRRICPLVLCIKF